MGGVVTMAQQVELHWLLIRYWGAQYRLGKVGQIQCIEYILRGAIPK